MYTRALITELQKSAEEYPIVTVTGPRQSGKSTLLRMAFPDYDSVSLEDMDMRRFALEDPRVIQENHLYVHYVNYNLYK